MDFLNKIGETISSLFSEESVFENVFSVYTFTVRFLLPLLALFIILRCALSLFSKSGANEVWGYLSLPNGARIELNHWDNIIGRAAKTSDVVMEYPTLSRSHAALIRSSKGVWTLYDLNSKSGVIHQGRKIEGPTVVQTGDVLNFGGIETVFISKALDVEQSEVVEDADSVKQRSPGFTLTLLTAFMLLLGVQLCIAKGTSLNVEVPLAFIVLIALMWLCYFLTRALGRVGFEIEMLAFFLSSLNFMVAADSDASMVKEVVFLVAGLVLFWLLGWFLSELERAKKMRWPIAFAGLALLMVNLLTAESLFGAKNWLSIGSISFQPSEFVKICFVFAGAATLDRLFAKRNLIFFIAFAGACVGCLALMSDFGTAAVFFTAYLVIAFMRSGSFTTVFLSAGGAVFAGFLAITMKPYIADRFATWGKAWQYAYEGGYQQTRTMACAASGGLFGLGAGKGWLKNVFAADTDMVFGMICEELGIILALMAIAVFIIMAFFTIRSSKTARSSFFVIASCAAMSMFLMQIILNVFGSLDILPFTGVTFPFVSRGGSSFIASWGMLSFIKAVDTRENASFANKSPLKLLRREKKAGKKR